MDITELKSAYEVETDLKMLAGSLAAKRITENEFKKLKSLPREVIQTSGMRCKHNQRFIDYISVDFGPTTNLVEYIDDHYQWSDRNSEGLAIMQPWYYMINEKLN